jgi:RimJ/RimL family protein N-acetyltransferase
MVPELRTERLLMRGFRDEDLDEWAVICADGETMRWLGQPDGLTREEAWRKLAFLVGHWQLRGYGDWALVERATGRLIGRAGLSCPEGWPGVEVGWLVERPSWGRGFASEAARAAVDWARDELGLTHLISLILDDNERSARVAETLGMRVEGRARIVDGRYDVRVFGMDLVPTATIGGKSMTTDAPGRTS